MGGREIKMVDNLIRSYRPVTVLSDVQSRYVRDDDLPVHLHVLVGTMFAQTHILNSVIMLKGLFTYQVSD